MEQLQLYNKHFSSIMNGHYMCLHLLNYGEEERKFAASQNLGDNIKENSYVMS